jgi:hypothetical protein
LSGSIGGGLIPQGNGLFLNPITGQLTSGSPSQMGGPMMAQPSAQQAPQPAPQQAPQPAPQAAPQQAPMGAPQAAPQPQPVNRGYPAQAAPSGPSLSPQTLATLAQLKAQQGGASQASAPAPAPAPSYAPLAPPQGPTGGSTPPPATTPAAGPQGAPAGPQGQGWANNLRDFESGGNNSAQNPNSSAKGPYQFTRGTWNAYLQSPDAKAKGYGPDDVTKLGPAQDGMTWLATQNTQALANGGFPNAAPGDLVAAHIFGAGDTIAMKRALAINPNTPVGQVLGQIDPNAKSVFSGNAGFVSPDMPVSQVLANTAAVAAGTYKSQQGGSSQGYSGSGPQSGSFLSNYQQMLGILPQPGPMPQAPQLQGAPQLYGQNINGSVLGLEAAAGLLGARSLGQGLGAAAGNLAQGYQDQEQSANRARIDGVNMNNQAAQSNFSNQTGLQGTGYQQAMDRSDAALKLAEFMRPKPLGYMPVQTGTDAKGNPQYAMPMQGPDGGISMNPLPQGSTPERIAAINAQANAKTSTNELADNYKQSVNDLSTQRSSVQAGIDNTRNIDNLLNLLPANGSAIGPSAAAKFIKSFVNLTGLPAGSVTPDGASLTPQAVNDLKLGELPGLKSLFPRGFAGPELKMVNGILPNEDMNPQAVAALAQEMKADIQRRAATVGQWDKLPPDQQNAVMSSPGGFAAWFGQQQQKAYGATGAAPDPGASISPQGKFIGTAGYGANGQPTSGGNAGATASLPRVTDAAGYTALPRGTQYVDPSGTVRTKQ